MNMPWNTVPQASFEFGLADHDGCLAFFVVGGLHRSVATSFGERDAIRCSIVLLDGPEAGKEFEDVLIFNSRPVARLRSCEPGAVILARIGMGQGKGTNAPVEMYDADANDQAVAKRWYDYYPHRLAVLQGNIAASYAAEERKAAQANGRVQSQPHPTHAGSANRFASPVAPSAPPPPRNATLDSMRGSGNQGQPAPAWAAPSAQPAPAVSTTPWLDSGQSEPPF